VNESADYVRLKQLREELKQASKAPFVPDIDRVGWTFQAYLANAQHLLKHIEQPHSDFTIAIETRVPGNRPEIYRRYQAELYRLLLNYSASTSSLVDHTRILEQKLEKSNPGAHLDLVSRRRVVSDTGVAHFVKNLRNFVLHCDLPSTAGGTSFRKGDDRYRFDTLLTTSQLLDWGGWDKESKKFLIDKDQVSLSMTVIDYDTLVQVLYQWMFQAIHQVTFENAHRKVNLDIALTSLERKWGSPTGEDT
jgi:hypothetical protein